MELKIPQTLLDEMGRVEAKIIEDRQRKERARQDGQARLKAIADLREARKEELKGHARFIAEWRNALDTSDTGVRLSGICDIVCGGKMRLYVGRYWLGQPVRKKGVITVRAELHVSTRPLSHEYTYQELHKGSVSSTLRARHEEELVSLTHPDFIKEVREHLESENAWKYVIAELELYGKRY